MRVFSHWQQLPRAISAQFHNYCRKCRKLGRQGWKKTSRQLLGGLRLSPVLAGLALVSLLLFLPQEKTLGKILPGVNPIWLQLSSSGPENRGTSGLRTLWCLSCRAPQVEHCSSGKFSYHSSLLAHAHKMSKSWIFFSKTLEKS